MEMGRGRLLGGTLPGDGGDQAHVATGDREADEELLAGLDAGDIGDLYALVGEGVHEAAGVVAHAAGEAEAADDVEHDPAELLAQLVQALVRTDQANTHRAGARPHALGVVCPFTLHKHLDFIDEERPVPALLRVALRLLLERRTDDALEDHG